MIGTPYDFIADQFNEARTRLRPNEERYLALLLDRLEPGSSVLDLGCGTGQPIALQIADRGHHVVGVDGSEKMLAFARQNLPSHRWIHALMEDVDFTETFDAAVCWDSLFHLPRVHFGLVITKVHRWLRPGGRFMVSSGGDVHDGVGFTDTMFDHELYYDSLAPAEIVATIERAGFDIVLAEMCDLPDRGRNKGKWATVAERRRTYRIRRT